jgi:hypothetical protein
MNANLEKFREFEGSQFLSRLTLVKNNWVCGDSIGQIHKLEACDGAYFDTMSSEGVTNNSMESAITAIAANPIDEDCLLIAFNNTIRYVHNKMVFIGDMI